MRVPIILVLIISFNLFLQIVSINAEDFGSSADEVEARGILSSLGGGLHEKLRKFVTTVKDILLGHHKKIGGFHYRLKDCFEKIIALEKKLYGLKGESTSCPDISVLVDKVKEKLYANDYTVNPHDVQSMAGYLQSHLKSLDARLQQENKYLNLAYEHIKYLQNYNPSANYPPHPPHPQPAYPQPQPYGVNYMKQPQVNPSIKMRDGNSNANINNQY
ncbi:uncharacterized protein LOC128395206 [Panonychus citri]|uniref:uncharacterized protein LOC128395206 n=1 Tax=Panonychus citri TaxID=50023 RepID=UPI0023075F79|nr:uncharacterized protein LOC128395206 [Panonychus citri]